jgi:hypothetical protein
MSGRKETKQVARRRRRRRRRKFAYVEGKKKVQGLL